MTRMKVVQQFKAKPVFDALPALSGYAEEQAILRDAVEGSAALKDAILAALGGDTSSLGNASGKVARFRPTTADRTGHRPQEITARPIGEIIKPIVERVLGNRE